MWADQVSSNDEASAHRKSAVVTGFEIESAPPDAPTLVSEEPVPEVGTEEVAQDKLDKDVGAEGATGTEEAAVAAPVAFPASDAAEEAAEAPSGREAPTESAVPPVAFPSSDDAAPVAFPSADEAAPVAFPTAGGAAPLAFPTSPDTGSVRGSIAERAAPGVTFQESATPERTGTPDPEADGKRRRTLIRWGFDIVEREHGG